MYTTLFLINTRWHWRHVNPSRSSINHILREIPVEPLTKINPQFVIIKVYFPNTPPLFIRSPVYVARISSSLSKPENALALTEGAVLEAAGWSCGLKNPQLKDCGLFVRLRCWGVLEQGAKAWRDMCVWKRRHETWNLVYFFVLHNYCTNTCEEKRLHTRLPFLSFIWRNVLPKGTASQVMMKQSLCTELGGRFTQQK